MFAGSRAVKLIMLGEDPGFFPIDLGDLVTGRLVAADGTAAERAEPGPAASTRILSGESRVVDASIIPGNKVAPVCVPPVPRS